MNQLNWLGIFRLGLVQMSLGSIVVLTTSTMNRVMVVEYALPAMLPGALVALHYALQILRPRLGHGSDTGGRRTPWIIGGMATLALGGMLAAVATAWMSSEFLPALLLAIVAFTLIGVGVGAAGTSLLVLLAKRVDPARRAAAATVVWIMLIGGFAITAGTAGHLLDPFSPQRLVAVTVSVSIIAFLVSLAAIWGVEGHAAAPVAEKATTAAENKAAFREALAQVWDEPHARRFTIFIFVSMLAYGAQELILDPFAGSVFSLTPGESTKLSGIQHGGVFLGMILVALGVSVLGRGKTTLLRAWTIGGCLGSAVMIAGLAAGGFIGSSFPLRPWVFVLGVANGIYAIAAIGTMMALVGAGRESREGVRMGLWGASQAIAFGLGGVLVTVASDLARYLLGSPALSYAAVFAIQSLLFIVSAGLATRIYTKNGEPAGLAAASPSTLQAVGVSQS